MRVTRIAFATCVGLLAGPGVLAEPARAAGNAKVAICHIPPGNPGNFHTITISENALSAHLAHGDLGEPCNAACAALCDDGNACTIDESTDCEQQGCPTTRELVDCDDHNACTADSCDPVTACANAPLVGAECDDGQVCSGPDLCNADGQCVGAAIEECCFSDEDCSADPCMQASCNLDTHRCGEAPVVCIPANICLVSTCAPDTGECVSAKVVCPDGQRCDPDAGGCNACQQQHTESLCKDGCDNDRDGLTDTRDPDCTPCSAKVCP